MIKYGNANEETINNGKIIIKKNPLIKKQAGDHSKVKKEIEKEIFELNDRIRS